MSDNKNRLIQDLDALLDKLVDYEVTPNEAQARATEFLSLSYRVNSRLRDTRLEIIKAKVLSDNAYSNAFKTIDEKVNVSKAKALASADREYLKNSVELQKLESEESFWKGMFEVVNNGHIFYKMLTRV